MNLSSKLLQLIAAFGFAAIFMPISGSAQNASLTLKVTGLPQAYPLLYDTLFFAGDPNSWNPWDQDYALEKQVDGTWEIQLNGPSNIPFNYKITRGYGWDTVEGSSNGSFIQNRTAIFNNGIEEITVAGWEDIPTPHTASNTSILHSGSYMSALDRHRRVWIRLPDNYEESLLDYPVVYMHDAQNLFSQGNSFAGEWQIDESMAELQQSCNPAIIVGIDNGAALRIDEYAPYINAQYGGGEGSEYLNYLVTELKPFIDANFRTLSDPENTAIMGSSLGGLISMFAAKSHPEVFGKIGLFSPAFWFNPELFDFVENASVNSDQQFYFIAGSNESSSMVPLMEQMAELLVDAGHPSENVFITDHQDGAHSEWYWAREFPAAFEWFFCSTPSSVETREKDFYIAPNPVDSVVSIYVEHPYATLELLDVNGKLVFRRQLSGQGTISFPVHTIPSGLYFVRLQSENKHALTEKLVIQH